MNENTASNDRCLRKEFPDISLLGFACFCRRTPGSVRKVYENKSVTVMQSIDNKQKRISSGNCCALSFLDFRSFFIQFDKLPDVVL